MQINFQNIPRQTYSNKKQFQTSNLHLTPQLSHDTVSFTGYWDLMKLSDATILKRVEHAKSDLDNFIGQGGQARIYKIPKSDYCVRVAYFEADDLLILDRNIDEADKVNHIAAKLGVNSSIMHYIEGEPVLTPNTGVANAKRIADDIAKMPVKSFNDLLHQICHAYDVGMMFDCYWGNIIVNPKENKLTAIDFYKNVEEEALKPLGYIFASLVHEHTTPKQAKIYANKILNAALEEFEPGHKPFWNVTYFDFSSLLSKVNIKSRLVKTPQFELISKYLETLKDLKVQDIRGFDVNTKLDFMLKMVKSLINQTL